MKNLLFITLIICSFNFSAEAQIKFGVKGGIMLPTSPGSNSMIVNRTSPRNEFLFNVHSVENGVTLGVFAEKSLSEYFFLRGELLYNQFQTTYDIRYTWNERVRESDNLTYTEKTQRVDMPVTLGVRLSSFEITTGVVARYVLDNRNEMEIIDGFESSLNPLQLGLQAGIGVNIANLNIGLAYQMDFTQYGEHMLVNGTPLSIQNSPARLIATIGYKF